MKNRLLIMLLFVVLALSACQSSTPTPVETTSIENTATAQVNTPTALAGETSTPVRPAETASSDSAPVSGGMPGCVASSPFPTPGPTEQSLFPPPGERDWVKGPDSATVTFTEYSDFQ